MNASAVDQLGDLWVCAVVAAQVFNEVEQELSAHNFIAMHVAYVLELWLPCQDTTQVIVVFWNINKREKNNLKRTYLLYTTHHAHGPWGCQR